MGGGSIGRSLGLSVLLAGAGAPLWAHGDGTFEAPLALSVYTSAVGCTAGDFNADGKLDLAAVGGGAWVTVWLQGRAGRLDWTRAPAVEVGFASYFVRAADFDGDGDDDLVVADPGSTAYVLRSKGDGTFEAPVPLSEARGPRWVSVTDLDGDGELDLATANHAAHTVT